MSSRSNKGCSGRPREGNGLEMFLRLKHSYNLIREMLAHLGYAMEVVYEDVEQQEAHLNHCKNGLIKVQGLINHLEMKCKRVLITSCAPWCFLQKKYDRVSERWLMALSALRKAKRALTTTLVKEEDEETLVIGVNEIVV